MKTVQSYWIIISLFLMSQSIFSSEGALRSDSSLADTIAALVARMQEMSGRIDGLQQENETLKRRVCATEYNIETLDGGISDALRATSVLRGEVASLQAQRLPVSSSDASTLGFRAASDRLKELSEAMEENSITSDHALSVAQKALNVAIASQAEIQGLTRELAQCRASSASVVVPTVHRFNAWGPVSFDEHDDSMPPARSSTATPTKKGRLVVSPCSSGDDDVVCYSRGGTPTQRAGTPQPTRY